MSPNSDNEGATRNGSAGREYLHDLPEHENIVEHFYDPGRNMAGPGEPVREKTPFSLIGNLIFLFTIAILAAISWLIYSSWSPQNTADLPASCQRKTLRTSPNLKQAINRDASVSFSEEDINRYLASSVHPQQHGALAIFATNPAVGIRLHGGKEQPDGAIGEGCMEIIIERYTGIDSRQTISLFLTPLPVHGPAQLHGGADPL